MIAYPGIAWWREIYDMPYWVWEQLNQIAERRTG